MQRKYTEEMLIETAINHQVHFTTIKNWKAYASEHKLPTVNTFVKNFGSWKAAQKKILGTYFNTQRSYSKEELVEIAREHNDQFTTTSNWISYAKKNQLPKDYPYKKEFGSWTAAKERIFGSYISFGLPLAKRKEELTEIAKEHQIEFTTTRNWSSYAKKENLPNEKAFIQVFGSWKAAHEEIFGRYVNLKVAQIAQKKKAYSKEYLIYIAKEHREHFKSFNHWSAYARENQLPSTNVFIKNFGTWNNAYNEVFGTSKIKGYTKYTKELLIQVAREHRVHFTSMRNWDNYAKENRLPNHTNYVYRFKTWNAAKKEIKKFKYSKEALVRIAKEHKEYFTSAPKWITYTRNNNLPGVTPFVTSFGSWVAAHEHIFGGYAEFNKPISVTNEELIEIAQKHKEHFTSLFNWITYSKSNNLPDTKPFIEAFGSWKAAHEHIFGGYTSAKRQKSYTIEELVQVAKKHKEHFTTNRNWVVYSKENRLPSVKQYEKTFGSWIAAHKHIFDVYNHTRAKSDNRNNKRNDKLISYIKEELINIAKEHKTEFTSAKNWNDYSRKHKLPGPDIYRYTFGDWKTVHIKVFGQYIISKELIKYSKEELTQIAKGHKEYFKTLKIWDKYAHQEGLPKSREYVLLFNSWLEAHTHIFGDYNAENYNKAISYTKEELIQIAIDHKERFTSVKVWTAHTKNRKLPSTTTYRNVFGSWKKSHQEIFGYYSNNRLEEYDMKSNLAVAKENLMKTAIEHKKHFTTAANWNRYAQKKDLPTSEDYNRFFPNWPAAKKEIFEEEKNKVKFAKHFEDRKEELKQIAFAHKKHFATRKSWKKYSRENDLPRESEYRKFFGSWDDCHLEIFGTTTEIRKPYIKIYNKNNLAEIAIAHQKHFTTIEDWTKHANAHGLPSIATFARYYKSWGNAKAEIFKENL